MILLYVSTLFLSWISVLLARWRMNVAEARYVELAKKATPANGEPKCSPAQNGSGTAPPMQKTMTINAGEFVCQPGNVANYLPAYIAGIVADQVKLAHVLQERDRAEAKYGSASNLHERLAGVFAFLMRHPKKASLTIIGKVDLLGYLAVAQYAGILDFGRVISFLAQRIGL